MKPPAAPTPTHETRLAHEIIAQVARRSPDALAVACRGVTLSYADLMARAERLAGRLRMRGVASGTLVGLCIERSVDQVVGMLGVWMSGAAYVPLDPEYPAQRRQAILADARPAVVVAQARHAAAACAPDGELPTLLLDVDDEPETQHESSARAVVAAADDLAYVLYTSGSTGAPKGVMVEHGALAARVEEMLRAFDIGPEDRVSNYPSINWDASLFDTLLPLCAGASLHVMADEARIPGLALVRFLRDERISATLLPPSVVAALPDMPLPDLRILFVGGEAVPASLVERWGGARRRVVNLYGPTEATVWCTTAELRPGEDVTIGLPVTGTYARILDGNREVADGHVGEICMGGAGLARGYLGRPDATEERFMPDPSAAEARLYRTGDLGRRRPQDGLLEYLGRVDRQVKIRGMRIEPAEVEAALGRHERVRDAVVEAEPDARGDMRLVAYVVPRAHPMPDAPRRPDAMLRRELRAFLSTRLPGPMVPGIFVELPTLPLTPNGKIDRRALPPGRDFAVGASSGATLTGTQKLVADAWAQTLGLDTVAPHDNFFDLGGHSLLVAEVQTRLGAALGREVSAVELFEHPTVATLAAHLSGDSQTVSVPVQDASDRGAARRAARRVRPSPDTTLEEARR